MISRAKFNLLLGRGSPEEGVTVGNTNISIINNIGRSYSVTNSFSCLSYLMWFIFDLLEQIGVMNYMYIYIVKKLKCVKCMWVVYTCN